MPRSGITMPRGDVAAYRQRSGRSRFASDDDDDSESISFRAEVEAYRRRAERRRTRAVDQPEEAPRSLAQVRAAVASRRSADGRPAGHDVAVPLPDPAAPEPGADLPDPMRALAWPELGHPEPVAAPLESWVLEPPSAAGRPDALTRRTVHITGTGAEGHASRNGTRPSSAQRHSRLAPHEREGFRPDRAAMWAIMLGMVLILVAAASSHAAVLAHHAFH